MDSPKKRVQLMGLLVRRLAAKPCLEWAIGLVEKAMHADGGDDVCLAALDLYEAVVDRAMQEEDVNQSIQLLHIPRPFVIYRCMVSQCRSVMDRACRLLVRCRQSLAALKDSLRSAAVDVQSLQLLQERLDRVNGYSIDYAHALWYGKAPTGDYEKKSVVCQILARDPLRDEFFHEYSILRGPTFKGLVDEFRALHLSASSRDKPLCGKRLRSYAVFLKKEYDLDGLHEFLVATIPSFADNAS